MLAINLFAELGLSELWIGLGHGKSYTDIPVHQISQTLGPQNCIALPLFHALTGCDVISALYGISKKTAWNAWQAFLQITDTFIAILQDPTSFTLESEHMRHLECLVILMYSRNYDTDSLNEARKLMFTNGLKDLDSIPPTKHAFYQHTKRALLTAAFIWKQSLSKTPQIPTYSEWGWKWNGRTNEWVPYWTDLAGVSQACSLLLNCGCVVACRGNCKCHRAGLHCSQLCKCEGGCTNNATC